jgi:hypothetical protein
MKHFSRELIRPGREEASEVRESQIIAKSSEQGTLLSKAASAYGELLHTTQLITSGENVFEIRVSLTDTLKGHEFLCANMIVKDKKFADDVFERINEGVNEELRSGEITKERLLQNRKAVDFTLTKLGLTSSVGYDGTLNEIA